METSSPVVGHPGTMLFDAVVANDHEALVKLYAANARNSLASYMSMKSRWAQQQEFYTKAEEKLDEFSQQPNDFSGPSSVARSEDDAAFLHLLQELSGLMGTEENKASVDATSLNPSRVPREAALLLWETANALSDSRPPADLCVYNKAGDTTPPDGNEHIPPIFDGSVANATPPPLGGSSAGASGGAGTILHLACAMDLPLVLAFLLSMGADGRASHTAFRRLMVHEAACNGSIGCLTLLLEIGKKCSQNMEKERGRSASAGAPFFPETLSLRPSSLFTGASSEPAGSFPPITLNVRHFRRESSRPVIPKGDYVALLRQFRELSQRVRTGEMKQLDAARALLENTILPESTQSSLIRSCAFKHDGFSSRTFLRPHGSADGHGNTPLHWAAFKNETECVSLLLEYDANPNARAHPSGWTPLHDAAYSNSSESIELLVDKGARVDARANSGATPLCFAAQEDASDAAHLLLKKGADLTARCAGAPQEDGHGAASIHPHSRFSGYTPLHYCAHYNAHKASHVLLGHLMSKAAMETPDLSGRLPIHVAVARGSSDVLRELLHAGARIDLRPNNGTDSGSPRVSGGPNAFFALPDTPRARRPPSPEAPETPNRNRIRSRSSSTSPVTSPVLRSMIPQEPINSSKPWNCLTQSAIDECKDLISKAEQSWSPDRHLLFTPQDRKAIMELLRVGKRLEQEGVVFVDLWPQVLGFCGRGWFEPENLKPRAIDFPDNKSVEESSDPDDAEELSEDYLALPSLSN